MKQMRLIEPDPFSRHRVARSTLADLARAKLAIIVPFAFDIMTGAVGFNFRSGVGSEHILPIDVETIARETESDTRRRLAALVGHGATTVDAVVASGQAPAAVLEHAARLGTDLIVMGVHGRGALDLKLFGSTTSSWQGNTWDRLKRADQADASWPADAAIVASARPPISPKKNST